MKDRIERLELGWSERSREEFNKDLREILTMFADSIAKLTADVNTLIAENGPTAVATAVAAAVAAKDASDAAAVDAIDATVAAAIAPPPPPTTPAPAAS